MVVIDFPAALAISNPFNQLLLTAVHAIAADLIAALLFAYYAGECSQNLQSVIQCRHDKTSGQSESEYQNLAVDS